WPTTARSSRFWLDLVEPPDPRIEPAFLEDLDVVDVRHVEEPPALVGKPQRLDARRADLPEDRLRRGGVLPQVGDPVGADRLHALLEGAQVEGPGVGAALQ